MDIDFLLNKGLKINDTVITNSLNLEYFETFAKNHFVNSETQSTKIVTYRGIELCFKGKQISYWQIEEDPDKNLDKALQEIFKMNFKQFLKFLQDKKIEWEFTTKLCFSNQLSVVIKDTRINFLFDFEEEVDGLMIIIGQSFS